MKFKVIISLLITSSLLIGCTSYLNKEEISAYKTRNIEENLSIVTTAIIEEPEEVENTSTYSMNTIISTINNLTENYKDNIGLYYYNFNTKDEYSFNEDKYFVAASLKKVPLAMQVLDKVQNGELTLDTEITYNHETDESSGTGTLQYEKYIGSRPISELIELSIVESDNIAYNMLNRICNNTLREYTRNLVDDYSIPDGEHTKLTAKQNFKILYNLYENPNNNEHYPLLIDLLKQTSFHDRLDKYIPYDNVAHKIGSYYRYYHDAGIIFGKENYILVILTKDIGELVSTSTSQQDSEERNLVDWGDEACDLIGRISKSIYDIIQTEEPSEQEKYKPIVDPVTNTHNDLDLLNSIIK